MNKEKIIINKNGTSLECDILFTFECAENGKSYIGYTDNSVGENGRKNMYVSSFDPILGYGKLEDITDDDELKMVREVLEAMDSQSRN